jgi:hypothetical protein
MPSPCTPSGAPRVGCVTDSVSGVHAESNLGLFHALVRADAAACAKKGCGALAGPIRRHTVGASGLRATARPAPQVGVPLRAGSVISLRVCHLCTLARDSPPLLAIFRSLSCLLSLCGGSTSGLMHVARRCSQPRGIPLSGVVALHLQGLPPHGGRRSCSWTSRC